jgi:hypothetical protein
LEARILCGSRPAHPADAKPLWAAKVQDMDGFWLS